MRSKRYTLGLIVAAALFIAMYTKVADQSVQSAPTYVISPEAEIDDTPSDAQVVLDTEDEQPSNGSANH